MDPLLLLTATTAIIAVIAVFYQRYRRLLQFLLSTDRKVHLSASPTSISTGDVALVILSMLVKSIAQSLGLLRSLNSTKRSQNEATESPTIPSMILSMPLRLEENDLVAYFSAIRPGEEPSATTLGPRAMTFLLAAITQPVMLLVLGHQNCLMQPLGAVNVRNRFEFARPDMCNIGNLKNLSERGVLFVVARPLPETRAVRRGYECDFEVELRCIELGLSNIENIGQSTLVFKQTFTLLQFAKTTVKGSAVAQKENEPARSAATSLDLAIEADAPSKWAAACKDYNPIHIFSFAAKLFGFPGKIAHGNLVIARALEALMRNKVSVLTEAEGQNEPVWIETEFKRPVVVPASLNIQLLQPPQNAKLGAVAFEVRRKEKVSVECSMGILSR